MEENAIDVVAVTDEEASRLTMQNKHGYVWDYGVYVVIDNCRVILKNASEVDILISRLRDASALIWRND